MDHHQQNRKQMASPEVALANEVFDLFCNATTLKSILGHFRHLCDLLKIKPTNFNQFYPKLKSKLRSWKAQALWKKFDQRANHKCYNRGKACPNTRVLIIGGGPCGMRSAIEAQLLGAKVVVVEKRDRMSRNNVLHLWPFVIQDLRALGAKKFFGKFCAGSIDHISIRQLQCILLKVALILGVEFHENVSFGALVPPPDNQHDGKIGWRAKTEPAEHPVSQYEFDVLIGADGKRNTLDGFRRKEFRGKLAIAITANFINKKTEAEARVEEISGVAFIFNQKFFKELYSETGIDLENIVYYKDETHYFVMTAKKHSLIDKGVILQDHADTAKLLAKENVDREALMTYAREAAEFSTEYQMMDMEFAVNHYGQPDVAMFDFTSMYAAENASRVFERRGHRLLQILVGDSLLEPFWPTGSGCARGFLSSLDACWAIKGWGGAHTPLEVVAERESIYRLLGQTTPENLNRDYAAYTLDPHTRYPNLNVRSVTTVQVRTLLDTDDPETFKLSPVQTAIDLPKKRRRKDSQVHPETLLHWLQRQVALYDGVRIHDMGESFKSGLAIAAIINRYRPDLIDYHALKKDDPVANNQLDFDILEKELGIPPIMTGEEMVQCDVPDKLTMFSYLTQIYEAFRGEIPHIKHPKLEPETEDRPTFSQRVNVLTPEQKAQLLGRIASKEGSAFASRVRRSRHVNENSPLPGDKKADSMSRRHARKRRNNEKMGASVEERMQRLQDIEKNRLERMLRRQYQRKMATQQFYKSMQMLQANAKREKDEPFEDYSIFLYRQTAPDFKDRVKDLEQKILFPDREPKMHAGHNRGSIDEGFSGRIKNIEEKLKGTASTEKKPKDLLRAIGKIEKTDWNVKEIEKKIEENKMGRGVRHDKVERVPKWSREQFLARQTKMEKMKGREPMETDSKYAEIDNTLKSIDRKIKEGNVLGHNKVSAMAEQFANKNQDAHAVAAGQPEQPKVQRSNSKATIALPAQGGSEMCHFCDKRVYLMERLTAEGKSFHRGCFRCEYCSTSLRIGNHTFDRDKNGGRFYCTQHFGLPGTMKTRSDRKKLPLTNKENIPQSSNTLKTSDKSKLAISGLDLLDRGQTPERIEFENLAGMSDAEEAQSIMDEDEWTDRNFGPSAAEMGSSDDISDMSDSDDDNEVFEEAIDQPLTTEGTLELAKNWTLRYSHPHPAAANSDTGSNEYEDSSDEYTTSEEDSQTATEDEDEARAREARKKEVWLKVPPLISDTETGSETEVKHQQLTQATISDERQPESGKLLPDAIPLKTNRSLPDLVASSPKLSGSDSPPFEDAPPLTLKIGSPDTTWLEVESVLRRPNSDGGPILVVTAPTPTTERPPENPFIEESKLIVPKEQSPMPQEEVNETPTSFDNLLLELRQRKAKNKAEAEAKEALKPLATETAKMQMSKYFDAKKKKEKPDEEVKVVELQVKSKISDKVEKKDMLKYFSGASFEAKASHERSPSPVVVNTQNDSDLEFLDELNEEELDLDEIEEEFRKIERQNKISLELLKSAGDKRRLSDSQVTIDPIEITQISKKSRDDSEVPKVSVADMVSKINASKSSSNLYINWNANDETKSPRKTSFDGVIGKLSPALQRKFSYDSASKPVVRVVKKNGSPAVLRRLSNARKQIELEEMKKAIYAVPRRFSDDGARKLVINEDMKNRSFPVPRRFSDDGARRQDIGEGIENGSSIVSRRSSDDSAQKQVVHQKTKKQNPPPSRNLLNDDDTEKSRVMNGNSALPRKLSEANPTKPITREVAKNGNSMLPPRKISYDSANTSAKQLMANNRAQDNLYRKRSYDSAIDRANEVDFYQVTPRSPLLDRLDSIKQIIKRTSSDLEDKVNGPKTMDKSSSVIDKETLKSLLLVSKLNHSNDVKPEEQVEIRRSRSPVKKSNDVNVQRIRASKSPSPNSRVSQMCKDIETKPKEQVPKSPSPLRKPTQQNGTKESVLTPPNRTRKAVPQKLNEQAPQKAAPQKLNEQVTKVPVPTNKVNDSQKTVNHKPREPVPLPKLSANDSQKTVNTTPKQPVPLPKSSSPIKSNNPKKTVDTKPTEQVPITKPNDTTKLKEQVSMPKSSSLVKEQQRTMDSKPKEQIASSESSEESEEENSATEISTDSEFEHDGTTPTQHNIPSINDSYVRKTRGDYIEPKKVQVKSKVIGNSVNGNVMKNEHSNKKQQLSKQQQQYSKLNALNEAATTKRRNENNELNSNVSTAQTSSKIVASTPLINPRKGDYLLNRTHSTEGIASKLSLELKKRYLLGGTGIGSRVMKSGSTSNVDTRLRNLSDAISQHQKLLNPAHEPSATMQAFLQGTNKLRTSASGTGVNQPSLSPISPSALFSSAAPVKAFQFGRKASVDNTADLNAKNVHLPDLIKESSNMKEIDTRPPPIKSTIIEEKLSPTIETKESPKEPDITDLSKVETPTPLVETKNIEDAIITRTQINGGVNHNKDEDDEMRSRSPLHETTIVVPQVDWEKNKKELEDRDKIENEEDTTSEDSDDIDSDSLSSSEIADDDKPAVPSSSPPTLQIHNTDGYLLLDEQIERHNEDGATFEPDSIECSYLLEEANKTETNTPTTPTPAPRTIIKDIESVNSNLKQLQLQEDSNKHSVCNSPTSLGSRPSSKNDDSEENDVTTAAYTETEFSEWARDGDDLVSEDLRDVEYDMNPEYQGKGKRPSLARMANGEDLTDIELDYSQEELNAEKSNMPNTIASKLLANGEADIGFMDTDNESLLEEDSLKEPAKTKNRGYIEFVNFSSPMKTVAPIAKTEVEPEESSDALTPCNEQNVIEFDPVTMDDVRDRLIRCEIKVTDCDGKNEGLPIEAVNKELMSLSMDEDSLLIVEPHEDTTTSELVTVLASPCNPIGAMSGKDDDTPSEATKTPEPPPEEREKEHEDSNNPDYLEYVKRLQSRIAEFSNVKDSIDIRKSKRAKGSKPSSGSNSSSMQARTAEMLAEEIKAQEMASMSNGVNSPMTPRRKLEELTRERSKQKDLIQDLLMEKLEAQKQKSAEKKAKRAMRTSSFTALNSPPIKVPTTPNRFVPASIGDGTPQGSPARVTPEFRRGSFCENPLPIYHASVCMVESNEKLPISLITPSKSEPPRMQLDFKTPIAPPRIKHDEARRTAEKARQDARERARLKSDEDLGLSPEDRIKELRLKVARRQLKSETDEEMPKAAKRYSFGLGRLQTSKSTDNVKSMALKQRMVNSPTSPEAKSLDELLDPKDEAVVRKRDKKKSKDPERRKSIIQAVSDFFKKKDSLSPPQPGKDNRLSMFRLTPKSKEKGKLDKINPQFDKRPKSVCEGMLNVGSFFIESPPPVPPPPINYTMPTTVSDDSLTDEESKTQALSTSQLNKTSNTPDGSCNSIPRKLRTAKRIARQAQLKRLRMAQEIQRKLEETEVKQRELEGRGVSVEKALRGEGECSDREEADLLREWFDLMRERTELRRYEKELLVRAQEVQLEDRHERLQQELRERLADDDEKKTSADVKKEGEILTEMLEIVARRDSLIALLEEERQRYQDEDRDLEAQMLSKGLQLTPLNKRGSKYSV